MRLENAKTNAPRPISPGSRETVLDFAVSQSPVIFYVVDMAEDPRLVFISSNVERITGHEAASFLNDPQFGRNHVHPDDMALYRSAGRALRATGVASREYRLATSSGDYLWFRDELRVNSGAPGRSDELVGCMIDITDQKSAEIRLRDSEALKSAISDAALNAVIVIDEGGTILEFNPVAEKTFGYNRASVIGRQVSELIIPKKYRRQHEEGMRRFLMTGEHRMLNRPVEIEAMRSGGGVFPVEINVTDVTLAGRRVFVAELWDTSERMRARKERERLSRLLHDFLRNSPTGIAIYDAARHLILCNKAYASFFGEDPVSMIGTDAAANHRRALTRLKTWNGRPPSEADLEESFAQLYDAAGEPTEMQLDDGRWHQITTRPTAEGGRVYIRTDITRLKQREAQLQQAQEILEDAIESLAEGFALYDADDRLVLCNRRYRDMNKLSADLLVPGARWADVVRGGAERGQYPDAVGRVDEWLEERAEQRAQLQTNLEIQLYDGRWHQFSNVRMRNGGTVVTRSDITHHKELQQALRENEALIRQVVESVPLPVVMARAKDGLAIYQSPAFKMLFGGDADVQPSRRGPDFYVDPSQRSDFLLRLREQGTVDHFEVELKKADGTRFWASMSSRLIEYKGEEVVVSSLYDMTERRAAEEEMARQREALRESDERFRRLLEAYPVPVAMTRAEDGEVIYESPAARVLFRGGMPPGQGACAADHYVNPADRAAYLAVLRRHGAVTDYELHLKKADGTPFWVSISARMIDYRGEEVIVCSIYDLTERRAVDAELARQRDALHQSEKLGALGSLLAGVAHELNNPLSVVVGQALLLQETTTDPKTAARAAKIGNAADRCSRIVRTFLAMARQQPTELAAVDVNEIVEATLEVTGYSLRTAGIDVSLDLADDLPSVWGDADQLNQVVSNLIVNAQQAMSEILGGGCLKIASAWDKETGTVLLSVKDSGPGIVAEIRSRIFEPFFTTKKVGAGTGIGLAVCHKIIEALQGEITVKSKPGEGAAFLISLPMASPGDRAAIEIGKRQQKARSCRVLVIDDEPEVTRMLRDTLSRAGHLVTAADSGRRALKLLSRHEFDVILCDLRMPNMDGPQLYETLRSLSPKLLGRVAFITGDTFSPSVSTFLKEAGRPFVQKPFSPGEIEDLIGKVLAGERIETLKT